MMGEKHKQGVTCTSAKTAHPVDDSVPNGPSTKSDHRRVRRPLLGNPVQQPPSSKQADDPESPREERKEEKEQRKADDAVKSRDGADDEGDGKEEEETKEEADPVEEKVEAVGWE